MAKQVSDPARERLDIILAEYITLRDLVLHHTGYGENRLKFLLTVIGGVTAGIGIANQWLRDSPTIYALSGFVYVGLLLFGIGTFVRTVERSLLIEVYTKGLGRIRRFFVESHPELGNYIIQQTNDDVSFPTIGFLSGAMIYIGIPGLMALINSIMLGTGVILLLNLVFLVSAEWALVSGVAIGTIVYFVQTHYYTQRIADVSQRYPVAFPALGVSVTISTPNPPDA